MAAGRSGQTAARRRGTRAGGNSGSHRRGELLGIAAELFATRGYAETTVRDIADEAGILSGSLYHHFSSKEEMLDEILRDFLGPLLERFIAIEKEGENPEQILDELIRHSFAAIDASPVAVALYQNESTMLNRQSGFEYVAEIGKKIEKIWLQVLKAGQKSGVFRSDVDVNLSYRFIRDAIWSTVRWYRPRGKYKHEAVAVQFLTVLHGGLHTT
ncbi:TetR/AcrR family transcriptional regulator [Streptomyces antnestii]|uniref:TetR/AcrR family transcriptional regulator n=1 Tax=Streptomyces antnestii TaxID=2494256 RepID=A0A3S3UJF3_9ACTN|nr:TetR/AcrR family transcriptional regulator [Streptomyces sp. San01]RVU28087.1 TetR/AcrR family transcriptional regulator [Streptomyces sp. San01]